MNSVNLYARLRALEPAEPVKSGTVVLKRSDGRATVAVDDGGEIVCKNPLNIAEGKTVFFQGHIITGESPNLPYYRIEI